MAARKYFIGPEVRESWTAFKDSPVTKFIKELTEKCMCNAKSAGIMYPDYKITTRIEGDSVVVTVTVTELKPVGSPRDLNETMVIDRQAVTDINIKD